MEPPVVIMKFDKVTGEGDFLSEVQSIYEADERFVDWEILVDDVNYIVIRHKRDTAKCPACAPTGGITGA